MMPSDDRLAAFLQQVRAVKSLSSTSRMRLSGPSEAAFASFGTETWI
jgi:hypothetical protein